MTSVAGKKVVYPSGCKEVNEELGKDELVRRLKLLARAFQDMGQDDNEQYSGLALYLASDYFMDHQSKDVRLLVACCIADVFRIFAPDAPYTDPAQLKEIFMFLIKQLRGLEDPDAPSFKRYFYLLENLAWVKSFNICIELEDSQEIFCSLFQLMFSIISEKHSTKVRNFILDMMAPLITEADAVSQELLDIILINIIEPYKTQKRVVYQLAKDLLIRTSNAIEPFIQTFFNNALMLGKSSESEVSDRLYDLIYELNQISPNVLLSVLPQLEFKLKSNVESERKKVTKLLAKMFSDPGSTLADQNKALWNCFLGRFNDISILVRQCCVSHSQFLLQYHPELFKDIVEQLKVRQHDPEETVRMEVVNVILTVAKNDFSVCTEELLSFIKERTLDKKFQIRQAALLGLGQLYKRFVLAEEYDKANVEKISWVKDKVFHAYYQSNNEDRLLVERVFNTCLVPYNAEVSERMKRLYLLYATIDDHAVRAFHEMLKNKNLVKVMVSQLVEAIEVNLEGEKNIPLNRRLGAISKTLPETHKATDHMKKFAMLVKEDKRMRQFLKTLLGPDCTSQKAQDLVKEVLKKLGGPGPGQHNLFYNSIKSLLERVAPVMFDAAAIEMLVKHVDETVRGLGIITDGIDAAAEKGVRLLVALSSVYPHYFKTEETYELLLSFLKHDDEAVADLTIQIFINVGKHLQSEHPNIYTVLLPILQRSAKLGNPKQSKHAIKCISIVCQKKEAILSQVFEYVKKSLNPESANFITSIVALGHIAKLCPVDFAADIKAIVSKTIVKDLLMMDRSSGPDTTESWYSEHHVTEETMAKLQAMKMLVRWLEGLQSNANNSGTSTLRLLYTVIIHEGDLMEKGMINKPELARLRLQAGCCMLKLAEYKCYGDLITREQFQALALLMNDSCYRVRLNFALKLNKGLLVLRLPLEYMSIFSLAANDPLKERKLQIKNFLQANISKRRDYIKQNPSIGARLFHFMPEYSIPYTIHLLAHDPDLQSHEHVEVLKNIKECLWFIMDPLISKSEDCNYSFFRKMLENIKQCKDAQDPEDEATNKKLYAVCDLALGLLVSKATHITLKDTNLEPVLPAKCFIKQAKGYMNTKIYVPKELVMEGHKRKGVHDSILAPSEPEIVACPGPVVNPLPYTPREKTSKPTKTKKLKKEQSESDVDMESPVKSPKEKTKRPRSKKENIDSQEENQVSGVPKKRGRKSAKKENLTDNKKTDSELDSSKESQDFNVQCSSSDVEENSEQEQTVNHPKRPGRPPKQTNSNSSSANSSPRRGKNSDNKVTKLKQINGASKKTSVTAAKDSPKGKTQKRSAPSSSEESSPVKKTRRTRATPVKKDSSESDPSSPISMESEPSPVTPSKKSTSSPAASRKTLTRSKLHSESGSEGNSSPVKGRKRAATKQLRIDQFSTKPSNVRRAKTLANGSLDGDSQESPSSASKRGRGKRK
ncbi:sister chromatid cohesion protein PDS5 homolog B-like [Saccostrea cucullata]|uniref:sister chromatid cohesion protein PDS5 homolog B-like n=1 Tax=Saccostrea cuccullata TaxID=36930 RepID=UPI002ED29460